MNPHIDNVLARNFRVCLEFQGISGVGNRLIECLIQPVVDNSAASDYLFSPFQIIAATL
jgi:hypothetical protein